MENIKENNIISKHINIIEHTNENVIRNEFWDNINISISILMRETISGIIKMLILISIINHDINSLIGNPRYVNIDKCLYHIEY